MKKAANIMKITKPAATLQQQPGNHPNFKTVITYTEKIPKKMRNPVTKKPAAQLLYLVLDDW